MAKRRGEVIARQAKKRKTPPPAAVLPLPDDLVIEVFMRLEPKSVAVCRCVSRSWNHLFSSAGFAERYRAAVAAASSVLRFVSLPLDTRNHDRDCVTPPTETKPRAAACVGCPRVLGGAGKTCHGIFLLCRPCKGELYVCNPATGGVLRLPPRHPPWYFHGAGLGYHVDAGEHKAVVLERVGGLPQRWWIPRLQCHVVTVGDRQRRWRAPCGKRAPILCEDGLVSTKVDAVFADGRIHWVLSAKLGDREEPRGILSFFVSSETFGRVPLPPFAGDAAVQDSKDGPQPSSRWDSRKLVELNGRLCMVREPRRVRDGEPVLEVWKLHNYESGAWSLEIRMDLTKHATPAFCWPRVGDAFPVCYIDGKSTGGRKKMLLASTTRAWIHDPDRPLQHVPSSDGLFTAKDPRLMLYHESPLHFHGMKYGTQALNLINNSG